MVTEKKCFQYYDHINVLIKPTDGCNLRCTYCFHQDSGYRIKKLPVETLRSFLSITLPHYKSMSIIWHGGEPTFVGDEYFALLSDLASEQANTFGVNLRQSIQTNGTLLSQQFIDVLKRNSISVGISYDGPTNDITRGSTQRLIEVDRLLKKNDIKYGTIAVISGVNVHRLVELYEHMKSIKIDFQMNPYINTSPNAPPELLMTADDYLDAISQLFNVWIKDGSCNITVDPFMRMIRDTYLGRSLLCSRSSCMRNWLCLNVDGLLSPCDRAFPQEYCYGYVQNYTDIRQVYDSEGYKNLITQAIKRRDRCQASCDAYNLCEGGCNNNALYENGLDSNGGLSCTITKGLLHMINRAVQEYSLFSNSPQTFNPVLLNWLKQQQENT